MNVTTAPTGLMHMLGLVVVRHPSKAEVERGSAARRGRLDAAGLTMRAEPRNIVLQKAGGPIHDWKTDYDVNDDLTNPHGVDRPDVAGWLRGAAC